MAIFKLNPPRPLVIAGPCTAETPELMNKVAEAMVRLSEELGFDYIFKASFDKANRTSIDSYRGPGLEQAASWFGNLKREFGCLTTTDVHETAQVEAAAEFADVLQIPAFLCRQTDLLQAAIETKKAVSVKKGQFLAPENCAHIVGKARSAAEAIGIELDFALMERGTSFGYGNLVVDMRGFKTMAENKVPVIFDVTHSTQQPSTGKTTGGLRHCAPLLARAAAATGYIDGLFIEVHDDPSKARSDAATQLSIDQARTLLRQVVPILKNRDMHSASDSEFQAL